MTEPHEPGPIYARVVVSDEREVQVGPVPTWGEALAVEEVMRERIAELVAAENLIKEVDGQIIDTARWDALHDDVLRDGRARYLRHSVRTDRSPR